MRFVFALLLLAFMGLSERTVYAADLYFEPTAEQSAQEWKAIKAQHKLYLDAKEAGDWAKARELALFHFTRAWAFNNEALELVQSGWDDPAKLNEAVLLYESALAECSLAEKKGRYLDEVKDCQTKAGRTLESVKRRLDELSK